MRIYSIQHRCFAMRAGVPETFYEHCWIMARDANEANEMAARIPLDSRRRELTKVTDITVAA